MTAPPRASVLIGCWNNAGTLERAARSILAQTVENLELIVVDDGSTDETPAVARGLDDERVRYLGLPHGGISRSLNAGLRAARGAVVAIQDADDWSEPQRLERQLELLERHRDVAVVGSRMREVDEAGHVLSSRTSFAPGDVGMALTSFNPIPNSCAAYRRDVILALGGYDARYRYAMDYDLWLRVADRHRVMTLDEALATRVMSTRNVAARKERAQTAEIVTILARTMVRRRTLHGARGLAVAVASLLTPLPLKRAVRRRRDQAP